MSVFIGVRFSLVLLYFEFLAGFDFLSLALFLCCLDWRALIIFQDHIFQVTVCALIFLFTHDGVCLWFCFVFVSRRSFADWSDVHWIDVCTWIFEYIF